MRNRRSVSSDSSFFSLIFPSQVCEQLDPSGSSRVGAAPGQSWEGYSKQVSFQAARVRDQKDEKTKPSSAPATPQRKGINGNACLFIYHWSSKCEMNPRRVRAVGPACSAGHHSQVARVQGARGGTELEANREKLGGALAKAARACGRSRGPIPARISGRRKESARRNDSRPARAPPARGEERSRAQRRPSGPCPPRTSHPSLLHHLLSLSLSRGGSPPASQPRHGGHPARTFPLLTNT